MEKSEFPEGNDVSSSDGETKGVVSPDVIQEVPIAIAYNGYDLLEKQGGTIIAIKASENFDRIPRIYVGLACTTNQRSYMTGAGLKGVVKRITEPFTCGRTDSMIEFEYEQNGMLHTDWLKISELDFV